MELIFFILGTLLVASTVGLLLGAINYLAVGFFNMDLVSKIFGKRSFASRLTFVLLGSSIIILILWFSRFWIPILWGSELGKYFFTALFLTVVGAVNWALIGLFDRDILSGIFGVKSIASRIISVVIGLFSMTFLLFHIMLLWAALSFVRG